jgi:hypothetical protein
MAIARRDGIIIVLRRSEHSENEVFVVTPGRIDINPIHYHLLTLLSNGNTFHTTFKMTIVY